MVEKNVKHVLKEVLLIMRKASTGAMKIKNSWGKYLNSLIRSFGLIAINVIISLTQHWITFAVEVGVHIVLIKNYVVMINVKTVSIIVLLIMRKASTGVTKIKNNRDKYLNRLIISFGSIVIIANISSIHH